MLKVGNREFTPYGGICEFVHLYTSVCIMYVYVEECRGFAQVERMMSWEINSW